jgi:hypothetical protein
MNEERIQQENKVVTVLDVRLDISIEELEPKLAPTGGINGASVSLDLSSASALNRATLRTP